MSIQADIERKLAERLQPVAMEVTNESHMYSVPPNSETHFKVVLASPLFVGKRQVQRHQAVYAILKEELAGGVHALALHTFAPEEWALVATTPDSPDCMGGG